MKKPVKLIKRPDIKPVKVLIQIITLNVRIGIWILHWLSKLLNPHSINASHFRRAEEADPTSGLRCMLRPLLVIYAYLNIVEPDDVSITHVRGAYEADPGISRDVAANVLAEWLVTRIGTTPFETRDLGPGA